MYRDEEYEREWDKTSLSLTPPKTQTTRIGSGTTTMLGTETLPNTDFELPSLEELDEARRRTVDPVCYDRFGRPERSRVIHSESERKSAAHGWAFAKVERVADFGAIGVAGVMATGWLAVHPVLIAGAAVVATVATYRVIAQSMWS